jgi:hypothetical protein
MTALGQRPSKAAVLSVSSRQTDLARPEPAGSRQKRPLADRPQADARNLTCYYSLSHVCERLNNGVATWPRKFSFVLPSSRLMLAR